MRLTLAVPSSVCSCGPARALHAERVDQFLAKQGLRLDMHEQHAVLMQPDLAGRGTEMHARAQIVGSLVTGFFSNDARAAAHIILFLVVYCYTISRVISLTGNKF